MVVRKCCGSAERDSLSGKRRLTLSNTLATTAVVGFSLAAMHASANATRQWALDYLKANQVWTITKGAGITLAVIDTGVEPDPDLASNLLPGADFSDMTGNSIGDGRIDSDPVGHGTGIATLVGGSGNAYSGSGTIGLAPAAKVLPVRATTNGGTSLIFGLAPAIEYASNSGARVINLSLGDSADDPAIHRAIQSAIDHDIVVVAAVGNDGTSTPYYPAAYPGVLGVGAIDSTGTVWSKSNTGPDVALVAPGVHIFRDDNKGRVGYSDGTSEATAYVSAAAALVRSAHPTWTAPQVVAALTSTADKPAAMHGAQRDDRYGYGVLDVLAAVSLTSPPSPAVASTAPTPGAPGSAPATPTSGASTNANSAAHSTSSGSSTPWILLAGGGLIAAALALVVVFRRRGARHP